MWVSILQASLDFSPPVPRVKYHNSCSPPLPSPHAPLSRRHRSTQPSCPAMLDYYLDLISKPPATIATAEGVTWEVGNSTQNQPTPSAPFPFDA